MALKCLMDSDMTDKSANTPEFCEFGDTILSFCKHYKITYYSNTSSRNMFLRGCSLPQFYIKILSRFRRSKFGKRK